MEVPRLAIDYLTATVRYSSFDCRLVLQLISVVVRGVCVSWILRVNPRLSRRKFSRNSKINEH